MARMSDPQCIKAIKAAVTIPVMAKARIGHFVEAQILQALGVDFIDESEVLTPADDLHHINKHNFDVPVLCGCRNLGEALRRIAEGSSMIRTKARSPQEEEGSRGLGVWICLSACVDVGVPAPCTQSPPLVPQPTHLPTHTTSPTPSG